MSEAEETEMGRQGSRRPSIDTSADAVLRRLDKELSAQRSAVRDLTRAHLRPLGVGAMLTGAALVAAALLAPVLVAVFGGLIVAAGVALGLLVEDEDRVTGIIRTRRWCRNRLRRIFGRGESRRDATRAPITSRVAPWLFPDPRTPER
jgi:hypothetical protein